jgi:hypothetical protein
MERDMDKLPKTAKAVAESVESFEDYLIRKMEWVTDCYLKEGTMPSRVKLLVQAGIRGRAAGKSSRVQKAVNAVMERLSI